MTSENKVDSSLQSSAQPTLPLSSSLPLCPVTAEEETRRRIVKKHYEKKGYRVHSGLQFGCELVLYANDPDLVHSDFCIHIVPPDSSIDWRMIQTLVRSQSDLHKTLVVVDLCRVSDSESKKECGDKLDNSDIDLSLWEIRELAITTEHAPFRHKTLARKKQMKEVGLQVKKHKK